MTPDSIPVSPVSTLECRNCGAGAPLDEHFCPQCSRILALGRHGDYFTFFGLPRKLTIDPGTLERRFRELSRQFHPDYFYNASPAERLASFFLSLIERQELVAGEKQIAFDLPMNRLDIADYLGLTKETVSRMLAELRDRKLIRLARQDRVEILDRAGLQEMAQGFGE